MYYSVPRFFFCSHLLFAMVVYSTGNPCLSLGKDTPSYMTPVGPGSLLTVSETQPPAVAPSPVLDVSDVTEPPFPSVAAKPDSDTGATAPPPQQPSGQAKVVAGIFLSNIAIILATVLLI